MGTRNGHDRDQMLLFDQDPHELLSRFCLDAVYFILARLLIDVAQAAELFEFAGREDDFPGLAGA